jgi:hypothetical protein
MQGWEEVLLLLVLVLVVVAAGGALVRPVCWLQWLICCAASWLQCHLRMVSGLWRGAVLLMLRAVQLALASSSLRVAHVPGL